MFPNGYQLSSVCVFTDLKMNNTQKSSQFTEINTKEVLPLAFWPLSLWWYLSHSYQEETSGEKNQYMEYLLHPEKGWITSLKTAILA